MGGNGGFLTPIPSFPDFGVFDPCKGRTDSQRVARLFLKNSLKKILRVFTANNSPKIFFTRPGSRGFKKLSEFGNSSLQGHESFQNPSLTVFLRSRPPANQTKERAKTKSSYEHFAPFSCEFWCFSLGKQARFTLNFCSGMPLAKSHEPTFLWFGFPGPLLSFGTIREADDR